MPSATRRSQANGAAPSRSAGPSRLGRGCPVARSEDEEKEEEEVVTQVNGASSEDERSEDGEGGQVASRRNKRVRRRGSIEPQPLDHASADTRLRTLKHDYAPLAQMATQGITFLSDAAVQLEESEEGNEKVDDLDADVRALIDLQAEGDIRRDAIDAIREEVLAGGAVYDAAERYKAAVEKKLAAYRAKTSRQKYARNKAYEGFRNAVWEVHHDDAMPPITDMVDAEDGDEVGSDDDIVVGGMTQDFKCPLSLRLLEDPVTSTVCPHSYSRALIREYVEQHNRTNTIATCPVTGCSKIITLSYLRDDKRLAKRVEAYERRQEEREIRRRGTQPAAEVLD